MTTIVYSTTLKTTACKSCGVPYALPDGFLDTRREDHATWYCPNGHHWHYPQDNEVETLKKSLKWERDRLASERARADGAEASLRATKGHVTRLRNQVLAGECPLCGQHLRDLARHISRQHPDETAEPQP